MSDREPFFYTIHITGNDSNDVKIDNIRRNGEIVKNFVISSSAGDFEWDAKGEYGPFGSFYAVFDSDGNMRYHMDARDLTKNVNGEKVIDENGLKIPNGLYSKNYSIMWVLPKLYVSSDKENLVVSNFKGEGSVPLAHSLDLDGDGKADKEFNYLGIGVYHSYVDNGIAYSMQDVRPTVNRSVINFGKCIESYKLSSLNPGYSIQWNWYQWSLLKFCTYIALGTLDSQSFAKGCVGKGLNGGENKNGMTAVAKNGYYADKDNKSSERLFIENAWGNVCAWLSNTFFMSDGLYVSQYHSVQGNSRGKGMKKIQNYSYDNWNYTGNPGRMYTDSAESWGLPYFETTAKRNGMKDCACVNGSDYPVAGVGGYWYNGSDAGVSSLNAYYTTSGADGRVGSRPVLLFDADAASSGSVSLPDDSRRFAPVSKNAVSAKTPVSSAPRPDINSGFLNQLKSFSNKTGNNSVSADNSKSVVSKSADTPSKNITNTGNSASDDRFYVNEFRDIFKATDLSAIISNPKILVGAMADKKFKKVDINIMRGIVSTSSELLIRILKKEKCNIHAVSKQISDDTGIDADKIEKLLDSVSSAVQ